RQARALGGRGGAARRPDPRHAARHPPDRAAGAEGSAPPDRGRRRHQEGVLPRRPHRPRDAEGRNDGLERRRHGHRAGRARHAGEDRPRLHRPALGPRRRSRARARARNGHPEGDAVAGDRRLQAPLRVLHGDRRVACRDQPADPRRRQERRPAGIKALDAKFNFDSNAIYRHPEIAAYRDLDEEDPAEIQASKFDLAYIQLDGNIGCLVNGAGLAMATMDTIKLFGGEPANFLDVGGGASAEKVTEAFKIMLGNSKVKAILVNIFGGIMRCDTIAEGVIAACKATNLPVPLVVRMKGTNEELGKKMLAESGLPIISADSMAEAAQKVMAALKQPAKKP